MCIGKGLSGGYMTLAAMLCTEQVSHTLSQANPGLLMHGPTFMANPLACRIACASIDVLMSYDWQANIQRISNQLTLAFKALNNLTGIKDWRVLGAIGVIELEQDSFGPAIQQAALNRGVWLRPFGKLVYTMPAYTISHEELAQLSQAMVDSVKEVLMTRPGHQYSPPDSATQFV